MLLKTLLTKTPVQEVIGSAERDITNIAYDSRRVTPGSLFVALKGEKQDGAEFVRDAIDRGAEAVVTDASTSPWKITTIQVPDSRKALADLSCAFYRHPGSKLKLVGVTGTNGKTTTTYLLKHLLESNGLRSGLLGTVRYEIGRRLLPASRTTPESLEINDMLYQTLNAGDKAAVMEVSSHALMQDRVRGLEFDAAIFTNLTQDHLDYHKTIQAYFEAKALLFLQLAEQKRKKGVGIINIDSTHGEQLVTRFEKELRLVTYGLGVAANYRATNIRTDGSITTYQLDADGKSYLVRLPLIGRFNVYNSLAALAAARAVGLPLRECVKALASAPQVPGRLEAVPIKRQFQVYVDYAHTDDALLNVLRTLRELSPSRLIVVFGCGGDRDRAKRPKMGAVATEYADYSIVTSDNPRKEDPETIIGEITKAMRPGRFETVLDRQEAIFRAIALAEPRDIVLIAGKGHETNQEFADHIIPFNDVEMVQNAVDAQPVKMSDS
ncbi:MAG TPA: UDP-N-acetylmuramoyl-L-alanyl-D-glutamate--2,6-diaminopimelate ligase [Chthoniobacterales bacterium]|jgi:UDP-N-acetylmuramoyl-L-alanyl-D-glutamate--2,6-diaminopimelate ligase